MWICLKKLRPAPDPVYIYGTELERMTDKLLGIHIQSDHKMEYQSCPDVSSECTQFVHCLQKK